jgi:hypothetical protein
MLCGLIPVHKSPVHIKALLEQHGLVEVYHGTKENYKDN